MNHLLFILLLLSLFRCGHDDVQVPTKNDSDKKNVSAQKEDKKTQTVSKDSCAAAGQKISQLAVSYRFCNTDTDCHTLPVSCGAIACGGVMVGISSDLPSFQNLITALTSGCPREGQCAPCAMKQTRCISKMCVYVLN